MLSWDKKEIFIKGYFWIPLCILLCPTFPSKISFGNQAVYIITVFILGLMTTIGNFKLKFSKGIIIFGGYLIGMAVWDILIEMFRNNIGPTDFLEILRPIGFLLSYEYYRNSTVPIEIVELQTMRMFYWTFTIIAFYCILEFFIPETFQNISFLLWKRQEVGILRNKATGPFFQTYNCAYALLIPLFWSFIQLFKQTSLKYAIYFILMISTMLLTQSKSMYVASLLGIIICIWISTNFKSIKSISRTAFITITFVFLASIIFLIYQDDILKNLEYAITGFEAMSNGSSGSLNTRQEQVEWALNHNIIGLVGGGIGKNDILLESLYALYYYRYGLIGIVAIYILIFYAVYSSYKVSTIVKGNVRNFYEAICIFFLINPIALSSSCHQDMPKTSLIFYGMLGLVLYRKYNLKKHIG